MLTFLNSNRWVAIAAAGLSAIYVVGMLCVPALPIGEPGGGISRISRAEFWLILVASLESIWDQWTAGYVPTMSDRILPLARGAIWLGIAGILGWPIASREGLSGLVGRSIAPVFSIAIGSALASIGVACNGVSFGPQSWRGLIAWLVGIGGGAFFLSSRIAPKASTETAVDRSDCLVDPVLGYSWARRLMGLTSLGIVWVLVLTIAGACLPTYDAYVHEHRNMAARSYYLTDRIARLDHHREANTPQGAMMPTLFWMNPLVGGPPDPLSIEAVRGMVDAALVGQTVQGLQWCIAIGLLLIILSRMFGVFASVLACFAIAAHPGLFELVRLGGGAGEGGMYLVCAASLLLFHRQRQMPFISLASIAAGASGLGWTMFLLVSVPILVRLGADTEYPILRRSVLLISVGAIALFWGWGSCWQVVQACLAWGRVGGEEQAFCADQLPFFFPPSSGAGEGAWAAGWRIAMSSMVNSLHVVPLAAVGLVFARNRAAILAGVWFGVWCLAWWLFTPQQDRDWVIAVPLLAWPMASGIEWMRRQGQGGALVAIGGAALAWSIVVLSAWPTSDNRLLVPLDALTRIADDDSEQSRAGGAVELAPGVNRLWSQLAGEQRNRKWLLLGSSDAFRWLPKAEVYGRYDRDPWGEVFERWDDREDPVGESQRLLRQHRIGFVVLDWAGWRSRDQLLGVGCEAKYRNAIQKLQQAGAIKRMDWEIDAGQVECYEVVAELSSEARSLLPGPTVY